MDYKRELKKMRAHREHYFPMMHKLWGMHKTLTANSLPISIDSQPDMLIALELLDIGYLNQEAFRVEKSFGDIKRLLYNGAYPFSEAGHSLFRQKTFAERKKGVIIAVCCITIFVIGLLILNLC